MKKLLAMAAIAVIALCSTAMAQTSVTAGYINNSINATNANGDAIDVTPAINNGAYIGVMYNYALKGGLSVAAGVDLEYFYRHDTVLNGSVSSLAGANAEAKYSEMNIAVPVFLNYSLPLGNILKLRVYAGPIFNFGLSSKCNWNWSASVLGISSSDEGTVDYYDQDDNSLTKFQASIAGGVAAEFNEFGINVGYSYGLTERYGSTDDIKATTTRIFAGITYNL